MRKLQFSKDFSSAECHFITANDIRFAYKSFGLPTGTPLIHLTHFRGTMDHIDPEVADRIAARRPLIIFDNIGVGRISGEIPKSFHEAASAYASFIQALELDLVDIWGYSMGGCVAQMLSLNYPNLVRRLVLCCAPPSIGKGVTPPSVSAFKKIATAHTDQQVLSSFLRYCFTSSAESQEAGRK
ncbi:unnamed protein product [Clonostachys chloroleuca]|uniref:AB hydrolase-1 domain-containing protein n=1 Tax=Clonostachys chloroleuca TaxID=1926264 RepID=A0AA35LRS1_9HYPO|nr:unnamed protein product [Clonostachys chloroleuca]